jgi:hypothetical protein
MIIPALREKVWESLVFRFVLSVFHLLSYWQSLLIYVSLREYINPSRLSTLVVFSLICILPGSIHLETAMMRSRLWRRLPAAVGNRLAK